MDMRKIALPRAQTGIAAVAYKPSRRSLLLLAAVAAIAIAIGWWFFARITTVTVTPVTTGSAAEIVYATGAVEPEYWAKVATLVTGRIVERCRCEGREVKAGDLLARLDDAEAQAMLQELRAREEFARKELDRQEQLIARGVTSTQAHERAATELRQVQGLIAVQTERLAHYRLVAPIDGIVLREDGEVGEIVSPNTILYQIGLPRPLHIVAEVNEEDIPLIRVGQTVLLRTDAFAGRELTGTVYEITPAGDPVARTFRIRVRLPVDTPLQVGMNVEANVVAREKSGVLLVPAASLVQDSVFVVENSRAERRPVTVGIRGSQKVEIESGLKEGELVVSPVPANLRGGRLVRVTEEAQADENATEP